MKTPGHPVFKSIESARPVAVFEAGDLFLLLPGMHELAIFWNADSSNCMKSFREKNEKECHRHIHRIYTFTESSLTEFK